MSSPQMAAPKASVVIPTRRRPEYLKVALASIAPQAAAFGAEVIVVDDAGPNEEGRRLAERFKARYEAHARPLGLNAARNTGVERSSGGLVVFVDDDVEACEGWLAALLAGADRHPDVEVFTGPVIPRLEGRPPKSCGREGPPVTSLQLGGQDVEARYAWGANMAIRRRAFERAGPFDVSLRDGGDEQEWQERLRKLAPAGAIDARPLVLYLAGAALHHRRAPDDARLRALARTAYHRGRAARRFDAHRGAQPPRARELLTLAGCAGHVLRRRCPAGLVMAAHSLGRLRESFAASRRPQRARPADGAPTAAAGTDDFLSGESGTVGGAGRLARMFLDAGADALQVACGQRLLIARAARRSPPRRRVLALCIERPERHTFAQAIRAELIGSRHELELRVAAPAERGKFENLNLLLGDGAHEDRDWLLVLDDDVVLPRGFLDRFLLLCERLRFDLAQPAHAYRSHAAWRVTRRRPLSVARQTQFVEIGPVTAFARRTFPVLLPFPPLRMGWGLDAHWAALARRHGWRCGVLDAVAVRHSAAPAASAYSREQALAEARDFLRARPYLPASEMQRTIARHYRW